MLDQKSQGQEDEDSADKDGKDAPSAGNLINQKR